MTQYLMGKLRKMSIGDFVSIVDQGIKRDSKKTLKLEMKVKTTLKQENEDDPKVDIEGVLKLNFGVKLINVRYMRNLRAKVEL